MVLPLPQRTIKSVKMTRVPFQFYLTTNACILGDVVIGFVDLYKHLNINFIDTETTE